MKRKSLLFMIAVALFGATLAVTQTFAQEQNNQNDETQSLPSRNNDLTGAWLTNVTPPPVAGPPFQGIFTFTSDGTMIATQAGGPMPALGNPQLGLWARTGIRQFTLTYYGQD